MRPVRTCWSVAVRGTVVLLALVCALAGAASAEAATNIFTTIGITREDTRANAQIRGPYAFKGEEMPPSRTVGPAPDDAVGRRAGADARHDRQRRQPRRVPRADARPARGAPEALHADPLLRHDGRRLGRRRRSRCASTTARPQAVPDVNWPDWCQSGNAQAHIADRPGQRPLDRPPARTARRAASSTAPPTSPAADEEARRGARCRPTPTATRRRARLPDGAHARVGGRLVRHARPLRRAELPERQDRAGLRRSRSTRPRPTATTAGTRARSSSRSTRRTRRAARASSRRCGGSAAASSSPTSGRSC